MNLRDFRIGWRLLIKEPAYSIAVVFGLAVGFAVCFLLLGFVRYCFTYNQQIAGSEQIYVVKEKRNVLPRPDWRARAPAALRGTAANSGMGLEVTVAKGYGLAARIDDRVVPLELQVADANYLAFFGIRALEGDAAAALARPDALVLSESMAQKLLGRGPALGKVVSIDGVPFEVKAVLPDMAANTSVPFDALVGAGVHSWDKPKAGDPADLEWNKAASVYVKAPPGLDPKVLATTFGDAVERSRDARLMNAAWKARLAGQRMTDIGVVALSDIYFDRELLAGRAGQRYGNKTAVAGLAALALLILLLASTNYVNLAAVRTLHRQREIGVRKVLGVGPWRLARQFIAESLVVAVLAAVIGLLLAWLALPLFAELVRRPLSGIFTPGSVLATLALSALVGLLSALYPAWLALRLPVSVTLQGRPNSETRQGLRLRRVLSVFQFAAAIALIGVTLAVRWQTDYASHADPGFDPAPLLVLTLPDDPRPAAANSFRDAVARLPGVEGVAGMFEAVGRDGYTAVSMVNRPDGSTVPIEMKMVSPEFFDVYGVRALYGRVFDRARDGPGSTDVVINARAAIALGFETPQAAVGQMFDTERRIAGIAPDLRYRTLRQPVEPMMYQIGASQRVLTVRASGNPALLRERIDALWKQHFPNDVLELDAAASIFAQNYSDDRRLAKILAAASVVATALASFGIYVLSAYSVKRRSMEIVMRKIHGARGADIGRLIAREFAMLIGLGALLGLPLAWFATERYLAGFVERAPMGQWPLLAALACVAIVAAAATARHTVAAMRVAPALAFRE